jgi:hypothetical protein
MLIGKQVNAGKQFRQHLTIGLDELGSLCCPLAILVLVWWERGLRSAKGALLEDRGEYRAQG